jgi:hypothetical protein
MTSTWISLELFWLWGRVYSNEKGNVHNIYAALVDIVSSIERTPEVLKS